MRGEWKTRPLGDVCRVIGGGTPSKGRPEFYGGTIPWATVGDMQVEMLSSTVSRITEDAVGKSATNVIPAGSVVIATRVGLGKVCMLGQDTAINQDLRGIIPLNRSQVSERYLFWWFKST
ncbi:MAG TPA: restriction endonuclease subunit S [Coriobacteriia bacterium]|nr:restriction endonuclease subunit S [Coriobacteriia bacterium]